jgi:hypothetical protein
MLYKLYKYIKTYIFYIIDNYFSENIISNTKNVMLYNENNVKIKLINKYNKNIPKKHNLYLKPILNNKLYFINENLDIFD